MSPVTRSAVVYVDGLNLYHGLDAAGLLAYRWLDIRALANNVLDPGEHLLAVRYFNAPAWDQAKKVRQLVYLAALAETGVDIHLGRFKAKLWYCSHCRAQNTRHEEKESDVAMAAHAINDVYSLGPDVVVFVSGDGDLGGAIAVIRQIPHRPQVRVAFPPRRASYDLRQVADAHRRIKERHLVLLPDPVHGASGPIAKPAPW